uniref:Uncharacterized protein n=1 Tax=Burkholderia sp. M701 TaxID=326454 RepID=V5YPW4_9BURK|nr:hypothetical protein [Burkholderia sp. M701]
MDLAQYNAQARDLFGRLLCNGRNPLATDIRAGVQEASTQIDRNGTAWDIRRVARITQIEPLGSEDFALCIPVTLWKLRAQIRQPPRGLLGEHRIVKNTGRYPFATMIDGKVHHILNTPCTTSFKCLVRRGAGILRACGWLCFALIHDNLL